MEKRPENRQQGRSAKLLLSFFWSGELSELSMWFTLSDSLGQRSAIAERCTEAVRVSVQDCNRFGDGGYGCLTRFQSRG